MLSQAEPVDNMVRVCEQFALRGKGFPERIGYERDAVKTGWNIHLCAGIRVGLPGAAQLGASFQQNKVVASLFLQSDGRQQP
jgi:hypothetical protein